MVKAKDLLKKTKKDEVDEDILEEEELSASAKEYEPEEEIEEEKDSDDEPSTQVSQDEAPIKTPGGKIPMTEEDEEKVRETVNKGVNLDEDFERPVSKLSQDAAIREEKEFSDMSEAPASAVKEESEGEMKSDEAEEVEEEKEDQRKSLASEHTFDDLTDESPKKAAVPTSSSGYFRENSEELPKEDSSIPHLGSMRSSHTPTGLYAGNRNSGEGGNKWHVLILVVIGLAVVGATVYLLKGNIGMPSFLQSTQASPTPTAITDTIVENPTPTPGPKINRAEFKIRVLNGTDTSGLAASTSTKLKDLGYQIDRTGNATNSAFTQTLVRVKEGTSSAGLLEQLVQDLSPDFSAVASTILRAADAADAEVILGSK